MAEHTSKQVILAEFFGTFILVLILLGAGSGSIGNGSIFSKYYFFFF